MMGSMIVRSGTVTLSDGSSPPSPLGPLGLMGAQLGR
jgi:hypothetical protein